MLRRTSTTCSTGSAIRAAATRRMPLWLTEVNVNADWGEDTHHRPWNEFAAAWWAAAYTELAPVNVAMLDHYNIVESPQFGLLDYDTGNPFLPYWIVKTLNAGFPTSSQRLSATSADTHQIEVTAARKPSGEITVLVVDRKIDTAQPRGGHGLPLDIDVILDGITPTAITLQQIDVNTSPNDRPDDGEPAPGFTRDAALPRLRARAAYDLDALAVLSGNGTRTWGSHLMLPSSDCSPDGPHGSEREAAGPAVVHLVPAHEQAGRAEVGVQRRRGAGEDEAPCRGRPRAEADGSRRRSRTRRHDPARRARMALARRPSKTGALFPPSGSSGRGLDALPACSTASVLPTWKTTRDDPIDAGRF